MMKQYAKAEKNMILTNHHLMRLQFPHDVVEFGEENCIHSEEDIFAMLGLPYLAPIMRNA
jgi:hypothetical protein